MISYLTPADFFITSNKELSHNVHGFCVVFFTSTNCEFCKDLYPAFLRVSESIQGCCFAIMNVDQDNMNIVRLSQKTVNVLEYVPLVIMYANGIPIATFKNDEAEPQNNVGLLKNFIINISNKVRSGEIDISDSRKTMDEIESKICETSTGIAICGSKSQKVCYLLETEAYK